MDVRRRVAPRVAGYPGRMATIAQRRTGGAGTVARSGLWGLARIVSLVTSIVVGLLVIGIVLVLLEANPSNDVVNALLDAGRWLADPFDNVFNMDSHKASIGVNW